MAIYTKLKLDDFRIRRKSPLDGHIIWARHPNYPDCVEKARENPLYMSYYSGKIPKLYHNCVEKARKNPL